MADSTNFYLQNLLKLLEKSNSLEIAQKMIAHWTNNNSINSVDLQKSNCVCSLLKRETTKCQSFHWNCILKCLTSKTTQIHENNNIIITTQFASRKLSEHIRIQFLTLLINIHPSLPSDSLTQFIRDIENDIKADTWTHYLLQKLKTLTLNNNSTTATRNTLISSQTSNTIMSLLGATPPHEITPQTNRKRKTVEVIVLEDTPEAKHIKLSPLKEDTSIPAICLPVTPVLQKRPVIEKTIEEEILPKETQSAIDKIKSFWTKGQKAPDDCFLLIIDLPFNQLEKCVLKLETSTESDTMAAIGNMTTEIEMSFQYQVLCISHFVAPYFMILQRMASRQVITSLLSVIKKYPLSSMDGLMYPLLLLTKSFNISQSQLMCKLIQEMTDEQRNYIWKKVTLTKERINGELYIWNDHLIKVFQSIIDKGISFDGSSMVTNFIKLLQVNAGHHTKSLVFGSFLVTILTNYCDEFKGQKNVLTNIIEGHQTFRKTKLLTLRDNIL